MCGAFQDNYSISISYQWQSKLFNSLFVLFQGFGQTGRFNSVVGTHLQGCYVIKTAKPQGLNGEGVLSSSDLYVERKPLYPVNF